MRSEKLRITHVLLNQNQQKNHHEAEISPLCDCPLKIVFRPLNDVPDVLNVLLWRMWIGSRGFERLKLIDASSKEIRRQSNHLLLCCEVLMSCSYIRHTCMLNQCCGLAINHLWDLTVPSWLQRFGPMRFSIAHGSLLRSIYLLWATPRRIRDTACWRPASGTFNTHWVFMCSMTRNDACRN